MYKSNYVYIASQNMSLIASNGLLAYISSVWEGKCITIVYNELYGTITEVLGTEVSEAVLPSLVAPVRDFLESIN